MQKDLYTFYYVLLLSEKNPCQTDILWKSPAMNWCWIKNGLGKTVVFFHLLFNVPHFRDIKRRE